MVHTSEDSNDDNSDGEDHTPSQPMHGESTDIEASEDAASEQEYALLKAMADADHNFNVKDYPLYSPNLEAIHTKPKSDATADVRTIF